MLAAVLAALAPAGASAFTKAVWGPITFDGVNQFPLYHSLGVSDLRDRARLEHGRTAQAVPSTRLTQRTRHTAGRRRSNKEITEAQRYHMRVLIQVGNAPAWANGGHSGTGWAPKDPRDYAQFIEAAAREYPTVHMWMIWGEPNRKGDFRPEEPAHVHRRPG